MEENSYVFPDVLGCSMDFNIYQYDWGLPHTKCTIDQQKMTLNGLTTYIYTERVQVHFYYHHSFHFHLTLSFLFGADLSRALSYNLSYQQKIFFESLRPSTGVYRIFVIILLVFIFLFHRMRASLKVLLESKLNHKEIL